MGRNSTGAITTGEVTRLELSYLLKRGYIQKSCYLSGTISWTNGSNIGFESSLTKDFRYIRLIYQSTNNHSGEVTHHDYKIELTTVPSI